MQATQGLSNIQKELLKLYAKNISDDDLKAIRYMLGLYFAEKASQLMDSFAEEKKLSPQDLADWAYEHSRIQNRS